MVFKWNSLIYYYCIVLTYLSCNRVAEAKYEIGVGRADCTGPAVDITFMGYAKLQQKGCGIHLRQFSRAYIIIDDATAKRVCYVTVDACMINMGIKREVIKKLQQKYNDTYGQDNIIMSGTHTHGGPGGFMEDLMYDLPSSGFCKETFNALVNGIFNSIERAHNNIVTGKIYISTTTLLNVSINRSPASYLYNPQQERDQYEYDVDKILTQLRFVNENGKNMGVIHWYAIHGVSMNNTNCLISSDNIGYASILFEMKMNPNDLPGNGEFVGAFASTNLGDVTPNIKGPHCTDTGKPCNRETSTCGGVSELCVAFGPGNNMFESTSIIAHRLFNKSWELWQEQGTEVTGPLYFIHQFVRMPGQKVTVTLVNGTEAEVTGCKPSMGYGFAAGTTDGTGEFNFKQGETTPNLFWNTVRNLVFPPTKEDIKCQHPKAILINTGRIHKPYQWQPEIVSTQIFLIGNVVFISVSGEFTTMAGRRLRNAVGEVITAECNISNVHVVITGLSNVYTSYIATPEEYQLQRYEGASTIFGPYTLNIYLEKYKNLAKAICTGQQIEAGPTPPDFSKKLISFVRPVITDNPGVHKFGKCVQQPKQAYRRRETVVTVFVAGNPRNNLLLEKTFLEVRKKISAYSSWITVANDANWETKFKWNKKINFEGRATIEWTIEDDVDTGTYKIVHYGYRKLLGSIKPYTGESHEFSVVDN